MNETELPNEPKKISRHQFYFELPLYELVSESLLINVIHSGEVEAYSVYQESPTTYSISYSSLDTSYGSKFNGYSKVSLTNKRTSKDVLIFIVVKFDAGLMKVGQYPSLADLQLANIDKKYRKQLDHDHLNLFKKAIGLAAHGIGAGSFVYLRRIFEDLIRETFINHSAGLNIDEVEFLKSRMTDKVDTLKDFLPSQLVDMKGIYSILSSGVHELSEEDCLKYFVPIKLSIELILDQRIEQQIKADRDIQVKDEIQKIQAELGSSRSAS
jgi:hypothetical protein